MTKQVEQTNDSAPVSDSAFGKHLVQARNTDRKSRVDSANVAHLIRDDITAMAEAAKTPADRKAALAFIETEVRRFAASWEKTKVYKELAAIDDEETRAAEIRKARQLEVANIVDHYVKKPLILAFGVTLTANKSNPYTLGKPSAKALERAKGTPKKPAKPRQGDTAESLSAKLLEVCGGDLDAAIAALKAAAAAKNSD